MKNVGQDAIVVQGSEAGGHRGTFASNDESIGLMNLIPLVCSHVSIPVIAAGGIMDGRGLMDAVSLGAKAVQMGTAFLTCTESGAHPAHKDAILNMEEDQTVVTRVYSGKWARGIKNKFYFDLHKHEQNLPDFPIQNTLTSPIRKAAAMKNNPEYMSLWAGQNARVAKSISANELMKWIISDAEKIKRFL